MKNYLTTFIDDNAIIKSNNTLQAPINFSHLGLLTHYLCASLLKGEWMRMMEIKIKKVHD